MQLLFLFRQRRKLSPLSVTEIIILVGNHLAHRDCSQAGYVALILLEMVKSSISVLLLKDKRTPYP
jgi:hypothetical protein